MGLEVFAEGELFREGFSFVGRLFAAMMFLFAEVFMHWVMFPIRLKSFYNAGMATAVGCGIIACSYFFGGVFDASMFFWYDYVLAVVWFKK